MSAPPVEPPSPPLEAEPPAPAADPLVMDRPSEVMQVNAAQHDAADGGDPFDAAAVLERLVRLRALSGALLALAAALALVACVAFASAAVADAYARLTRSDGSAATTPAPAFLPQLLRRPAPKPGSMTVLVMSQPAGAEVRVNGRPRGLTPAVFNVDCGPAQPSLSIEVRLAGHRLWTHDTPCRTGANLRFDATLQAASAHVHRR